MRTAMNKNCNEKIATKISNKDNDEKKVVRIATRKTATRSTATRSTATKKATTISKQREKKTMIRCNEKNSGSR